MRGILKKVVVGAVAVCSALGLTFVGGGAAFADGASGGFSNVYCEPVTGGSGQQLMDCGVEVFYIGLHHVRANNIGPGNSVAAASNIPCFVGGVSNFEGFTDLRWTESAAPNAKYKLTVVDCAGEKDVYKVDNAGNVTLLHTNVI